MNIYQSDLFPYITGDAFIDKEVKVTISRFGHENVRGHDGTDERKAIVVFQESKKPLILNKTNAKTLIKAFGNETDNWVGEKVVLYSERLQAFGEWHNAARIKVAGNGNQSKPAAPPALPEPELPEPGTPEYDLAKAAADLDANQDLFG